jgi:hypothetical protein
MVRLGLGKATESLETSKLNAKYQHLNPIVDEWFRQQLMDLRYGGSGD